MAGDDRLTLLIPNSQDGIRGLAAGFAEFCARNGLPDAARRGVQVALDELLSNTVRCGYGAHPGERQIQVDVHLHDQVLEVAIVDDAAAFNPLEARPPDTASGLDERPIGGLGIHVVRKLMDEMAYERREGRNRLTLRKRIADQERRDGHP